MILTELNQHQLFLMFELMLFDLHQIDSLMHLFDAAQLMALFDNLR